ncbi:MAG: 2-oxo acid dehydrogenase subunit E2 [Armatimonadetes bacterium]|nr:2-oxo acid dehydrogenase subunit E2 [Armatimonadota bacterium]
MPVEILMPELGESVHEGTVSRWLKNVGDFVKEDEPVVEIMTDKVNTELGAPASGVLVKIIVPEGGEVEVFHAMGLIETDKSAAAAQASETPAKKEEPPKEAAAAKVPEVKAPEPEVPAARTGERRWYSPLVRSMAKQHGVTESELGQIVGSGAGGRVNKKDIESYLQRRGSGSAVTVPMPELGKAPTMASGAESETMALTGMRKMIAEAMVRSSQVPVVSTLTEIDVTPLVKFRELNKDSFAQQYGVKLTYTPFFIKALTEALTEFPYLNSSLVDNQITVNHAVHMGVAVSLGEKGEGGLIVPVIRNCHAMSIVDIAKALESIAARARGNKLEVKDVQGATFTLTNPGSYGAILGTPMINAPQAGIAGAYGIVKRAVIVEDMIAVRSIMNLVLTYDHRLVDGLMAGRFLQSVKGKLEGMSFFK